jgi:hypothetical protein
MTSETALTTELSVFATQVIWVGPVQAIEKLDIVANWAELTGFE